MTIPAEVDTTVDPNNSQTAGTGDTAAGDGETGAGETAAVESDVADTGAEVVTE